VPDEIVEPITITMDDGTCLNCRREWLHPNGADMTTLAPGYYRWIIEHPAGRSHIGPQVVPGQSPADVKRLLAEWWRVSAALGRL
jgi:hypothetical protein